jgi:nucleotide-binding universal stress UspA family protein
MYSKILVPLDGSMHAEEILPHVEQLARYAKATLVFVRVIAPPALTKVQEMPYQTLRRQDLDRRSREAELYLRGVQGKFREKGIETKINVLTGSPVTAIANAARRERADLVAIASHSTGSLPALLGSNVAAKLLQRVDCPMLIVRSQGRGGGERSRSG